MAVAGPRPREARTHFEVLELLAARHPLEARSRPAAPTRSAPTSPRSATRWPATPPTGRGRYGLERQFLHAHRLGFAPSDHAGSGSSSSPRCRRTSQRRSRAGPRAPRARHARLSRLGALKDQPPAAGPNGSCPAPSPGPAQAAGRSTHQTKEEHRMAEAGIKELLEAGVHFGHQTRRWNPRMRRYIHGERDGIHIIDLLQTQELLDEARHFAAEIAERGRQGALRRHQEAGPRLGRGVGRPQPDAVRQPALARRPADQLQHDLDADQAPARAHRARGRTASSSCCRPRSGWRCRPSWQSSSSTSAASATWSACRRRSSSIDLKTEEIAVREAARLRIPMIGLVDTNCDPTRSTT